MKIYFSFKIKGSLSIKEDQAYHFLSEFSKH